MTSAIQEISRFCTRNTLTFIATMWCSSRLFLLVILWLIAPLLPVPAGGIQPELGLEVFSRWDSLQYQGIVMDGYEYIDDGKGHSVAFFPLFPLLIRAVMALGLPFEVAGLLVNNLAFIGALVLIYCWAEERHGVSVARWSIAALCWCPFSLYSTVIYTEGLFLLVSVASLRAFAQRRHLQAAFWGVLTTATRPPGMVLIPAFLAIAWKERRPPMAYVASLASGAGLLLYSLYCWLQFGEPLVFIRVQKAWQPQQAFHGQDWLKMFMQVMVGNENWKHGGLKDPWHPLLFLLICLSFYLVWRFRDRLGAVSTDVGYCLLALVFWLVAGTPLVNSAMVVGGGYLLWQFRRELSPLLVIYGFLSLGLIFSSGRADSAERYAYAIASLAFAIGLLLSRHPRWGYPLMVLSAYLMSGLAIRFAQQIWAA